MTNVSEGATFIINSERIDFLRLQNDPQRYDGTLNIQDAHVQVNTSQPWKMAGSLNFSGSAPAPSTLRGAPVVVEGNVSVDSGSGLIGAQTVTFAESASISIDAGSRLVVEGDEIEFRGGSYTGQGELRPQFSHVRVVAPTTIDVRYYDFDGGSTITTIEHDGHLTLNTDGLEGPGAFSIPGYDSALNLIGGDLTIHQTTSGPWATTFLSTVNLDGTANTPDIYGDPLIVQGELNVVGGLARINTSTTLRSDPGYVEGFGVDKATVHLAAGSELQFNDSTTIEGADLSGEGTITFNKSATVGGTVQASVGRIDVGDQGSLTMTGGNVLTDNFSKPAGAVFELSGGYFQVIRGEGTFNSGFAFGGGPEDLLQPTFAVSQGADVSITHGWTIGDQQGEFGRTQVSVTSLDDTRRSTLRSTEDASSSVINLMVGNEGVGDLFVESGGLVHLPGTMAVGRQETGAGTVTVAGVHRGHRAELDVRQDDGAAIYVGGTPSIVFVTGGSVGHGEIAVQNGGLLRGSSRMMIAPMPGSTGTVTAEGHQDGFDAEIILDGNASNVFIGGNATQNGGEGTLNIHEGGSLTADQMFVRGPGDQVNLTGGNLWLDRLDITPGGGGDFHFTGGTLHVDEIVGDLTNEGGTIAPGDSPGITHIIGNYRQATKAALEIELGGIMPGDSYDQLSVDGMADLGGTLLVEMYDDGGGPYSPSGGESFEIVTAHAGILGTFDDVSLPRLGIGDWSLTYGDNSVTLQYLLQALLTGDYDNSGQVEQADLDLVLLNWGESATPVPDGWINDLPTGLIDQAELDAVLLGWGDTVAVAATSAVPEPLSMLLFVLNVFCMAHYLRR